MKKKKKQCVYVCACVCIIEEKKQKTLIMTIKTLLFTIFSLAMVAAVHGMAFVVVINMYRQHSIIVLEVW